MKYLNSKVRIKIYLKLFLTIYIIINKYIQFINKKNYIFNYETLKTRLYFIIFFFFEFFGLLHTAHSQLISTNLRSSTAFRAQLSRLFP